MDRNETEIAELKNKCEDLQYERDVAKERAHTLDIRLEEAEQQLRKRLQV